ERAAYSETLLKAVRSKSAAVPLTTCFGGTVERLKRRLANVLDGRKKSRGGAVLALMVLAVAGLCAAIGFTPAKDASPDRSDAQGEYASMEEYVLSVIDKLKQPNGYTYSILPEEGSADGLPVEVTEAAADVRVAELEQEGVCMNLAPDGTLELWRFCYEVKPEDKAGALPDRFFWVGGNNITDDGYISDGWYYYLTMLRTDDDPSVYKLLDSSRANDGLWYNGCHYDSVYEYLYDFYADYAKLDVPRYLIPDFLNADDLISAYVATTSADCEARRYDGDGWYLYIPTVVWRRTTEAGEDCWYSAYWTDSTLRVDKSMDSVGTMEAFYRDNGFTLEQYREGAALRGPWCRYDADSGRQFANYLMPIAEGGCYIISTWWVPTDDDSVNEWGYSKKNQIENEAACLRSMAQSFTVDERFDVATAFSDALSAFSSEANAAQAIAYRPSGFSSTLGGLVTDSDLLRELKAALASIQPVSLTLSEEDARKIPLHSDGFILYDAVPEDSSPFQKPDYYLWNGYIVAAKDMSVVGQLNSDHSSTFISAWNRQSHRNAERSADSELAAPNSTAESIKASADSSFDYGGYLWFIADGYLSRYADGGSIEQLYKLPLADDGETPVVASLSVRTAKVVLSYHVGGAIMGHDEMRLFDNQTGAQTHEVVGYGSVEINGDTIVKTTGFMPPAPGNLRISRDCGKTWAPLGDPKYLYGMSVIADGDAISYRGEDGSLSLTDDYLYITGIDTSSWDGSSAQIPEPLSLRVDLNTGETKVGID
ncbi:MAG: hypothetical protein PUC62_03365, partial [Oscillospiraceae bacterium]|nr:hypothetical protein [Oscillospiraceae bacterium]